MRSFDGSWLRLMIVIGRDQVSRTRPSKCQKHAGQKLSQVLLTGQVGVHLSEQLGLFLT